MRVTIESTLKSRWDITSITAAALLLLASLVPKDLRKRFLLAIFLIAIGNAPYIVHHSHYLNLIPGCAGGALLGNSIAAYQIQRRKRLKEVEDRLDWRVK
jgi:hypothetical protein